MKRILIALLVMISYSTIAQNDAKTLLDEVSAKVKSYDNIALDFKYVLVNIEEDINQETRGTVNIQDDKYFLNILGITRIFNGTTLYSISPEDEEVTISSDNSQDESTITPSKMLSFYEEGYNYTMDIVQNVQGRKIQYIKLIPIDSNAEINHILLGIDNKNYDIYRVIEKGKNNSTTILRIDKINYDTSIDSTIFVFNELIESV